MELSEVSYDDCVFTSFFISRFVWLAPAKPLDISDSTSLSVSLRTGP